MSENIKSTSSNKPKVSPDAQLLFQHQKQMYQESIKLHRKHTIVVIIVMAVVIIGLSFWLVNRYLKWQTQLASLNRQHDSEIELINERAHSIKNTIIGEYYVSDKKKLEDFMLVGSKIISLKYHEHRNGIKAKKFYPMTNKEIEEYLSTTFRGSLLLGIDPYLLLAIDNIESEYNKKAKSKVGARGICQFMPLTAKLIARAHTNYDLLQVDGYDINKLYDPVYSKKLQIRFMRYLFDQFDGRVEWVLLAYNWGPDVTIRKWWKNGEAVFSNLEPEQQDFAKDVLKVYNQLKSNGNVND